jgi:hypothetical protein
MKKQKEILQLFIIFLLKYIRYCLSISSFTQCKCFKDKTRPKYIKINVLNLFLILVTHITY